MTTNHDQAALSAALAIDKLIMQQRASLHPSQFVARVQLCVLTAIRECAAPAIDEEAEHAAFEWWYKCENFDEPENEHLRRDANGDYVEAWHQDAWQAWIASQESRRTY